ncbi:MAG TPA: hypothetical protein VNL71_18160 [Chloroflexota bacterium]|nr:hypothetical protein [Chloroflexota bacterium]
MVRRVCTILCLLAALGAAFPLAAGVAHGRQSRATVVGCGNPINQIWFQTGATRVMVCPSTVISGQLIRFTVHTRRLADVTATLSYPDATSTVSNGAANGQGVAVLEALVQYNPINRYVQAQFTVTATRLGHTDQVLGAFTIAQATPLADVQLLAHPRYQDRWCPVTPEACRVRDNTTILIRVQSTAGAQVSVSLQYPDGVPEPCPYNDLTGSTFANNSGAFRCELPVSFPPKLIGKGVQIQVTAQVSSGGFTVNRSLPMMLVAR